MSIGPTANSRHSVRLNALSAHRRSLMHARLPFLVLIIKNVRILCFFWISAVVYERKALISDPATTSHSAGLL